MSKKKAQTVEMNAPDELSFDVNQFTGGLKAILEAILIVAPEPVDPAKLAATLAVKVADVKKALQGLADEYKTSQRGFELLEFDGLWRFYSGVEYGDVVKKFIIGSSESKLSIAALETLAIIAYRQPISRANIAKVRGVNVDGVIRTLLQRGFIIEATKKDLQTSKGVSAKKKTTPKGDNNNNTDSTLAALYITTPLFLEKLGISSLAQLEPLAPFLPDDFAELPEFEDIRKTARSSKGEAEDDLGLGDE